MNKIIRVLRFLFGYLISITVFVTLIPFTIIRTTRKTSKPNIISTILAIFFMTAGALLYIWSHIEQALVRGGAIDLFGVAISPRTEKLLTQGPYAIVRNPMALGAYLFYTGIAVLRQSYTWVSIIASTLPITISYFKLIEEKRLITDFGEDFICFQKTTPLFFPSIFKILKFIRYHKFTYPYA